MATGCPVAYRWRDRSTPCRCGRPGFRSGTGSSWSPGGRFHDRAEPAPRSAQALSEAYKAFPRYIPTRSTSRTRISRTLILSLPSRSFARSISRARRCARSAAMPGDGGHLGAFHGIVHAVRAQQQHVARKDLMLADVDIDKQIRAQGSGQQWRVSAVAAAAAEITPMRTCSLATV